jgi:1-acyl-sn-glycerol-3-phosphate acyltransferase
MLRLAFFVIVFFSTTLPFIGVLWLLDKFKLPGRRPLSLRYYRLLCRLLKLRIHTVGRPAQGQPTLIVSNHVSWLDIPVISAILPVAFVTKQEVASWPIVGPASRLLRSVYIDRTRRQQSGADSASIARRLIEGDPVVLFAEGTSSDGNRTLPFRSALVGAVAQVDASHQVLLQPMSIAYNRWQGLAMSRRERPLIAWYGDLDFTPHIKAFVQRAVVDVTVTFGEPVPFRNGTDRKLVTRALEADVRRLTAAALRHRAVEPDVVLT